jgi:hypothetical protein
MYYGSEKQELLRGGSGKSVAYDMLMVSYKPLTVSWIMNPESQTGS